VHGFFWKSTSEGRRISKSLPDSTTVYALQVDTIPACTEAGGAIAELTPTQYASPTQREPQVDPIAGFQA
jgi:hypothetical protein